MFFIPARFAASIKASLDAQRAITITLTKRTFENFEKFVELHMAAGKASLAESTVAANEFFAAKGPEELFSLSTEQRLRNIENTFAYNRRVADIVSSACADFNAASKMHFAETGRERAALAESIVGNVPAGPENSVALVKSSIASANAGYRQLTKTTGHVVELLEGQMTVAASHQFSHAPALPIA